MGGKNSPESINRYMAKAYDRISLIVPKGQKELIQAHAEAQGETALRMLIEHPEAPAVRTLFPARLVRRESL